jgi:hypothetical protein
MDMMTSYSYTRTSSSFCLLAFDSVHRVSITTASQLESWPHNPLSDNPLSRIPNTRQLVIMSSQHDYAYQPRARAFAQPTYLPRRSWLREAECSCARCCLLRCWMPMVLVWFSLTELNDMRLGYDVTYALLASLDSLALEPLSILRVCL